MQPMSASWMNAAHDQCLELRHGAHRARIAPAAGGRILGWSTDLPQGPRDWLVPIDATGWSADAWPKGGIFPLAPFSNRVRDAHLHWQGDIVSLEPLPGTPHALHGQAQAMAWSVEEVANDRVVLSLTHPTGLGGWPWTWHLCQTIQLTQVGLQVNLSLENWDTSAMPAGLGIHPYFTAQNVRLLATTHWVHQQELALYPEPNSDEYWTRSDATWTHFLSGWSGRAMIGWDEGPGLTMRTRGPLDHMVLHCNAGRYLCVEPATHVCDGVNLAANNIQGTGVQVLAPGETLSVGMALDVQPHPD